MTRRSKFLRRLFLALAVVLVLVGAAVLLWTPKAKPQIITLANGDKYQFVGVTYGTNHFMGGPVARLVSRLPISWDNFIRQHAGARLGPTYPSMTSVPSLCVWFRALGTNSPPVAGMPYTLTLSELLDEHGVKAGSRGYYINPSSGEQVFAAFQAVPRRSRMLEMRLFDATGQEYITAEIGRIRFPNPLYGRYPQWQPVAVPAVKMADDVEVRVAGLSVGRRVPGGRFGPVINSDKDAYEPSNAGGKVDGETRVEISINTTKGTGERWRLQSGRLSDATGNYFEATVFPSIGLASGTAKPDLRTETTETVTIPGTLWPDEAAWRLKLELKRVAGFPESDLVRFKNLPVPQANTTNGVCLTNFSAGLPVIAKNFTVRRYFEGPVMGPYRVDVEMPTLPAGMKMDVIEITADSGETLGMGGGYYGPNYAVHHFNTLPANAKTVDITVAVQKTRSVEFLVQPPKVGGGTDQGGR